MMHQKEEVTTGPDRKELSRLHFLGYNLTKSCERIIVPRLGNRNISIKFNCGRPFKLNAQD